MTTIVRDDTFAALDAAIETAEPGERASLVVAISARLARLGAGLVQTPALAVARDGPDRNLGIKETAELLGVSVQYCYRHADELGGIRIGRRLVFPARGLDRRIAQAQRRR